jgi:uncharacterized protein (DUF2236 family)
MSPPRKRSAHEAPRFPWDPAETDLGYFGPDSVTWRLHSEPIALVGGLRALLMQALHPGAMALLVEKSDYRDDPWTRLQNTVHYVGVLSFGPRKEADRVAAHVRGVHRRLGIGDPEQMAWVHACLVESFRAAPPAGGSRLARAHADRYVREQVRAAELAGVPAEWIMRDLDELVYFMSRIRPRLAGTREARAASRFVIVPPLPVPVVYRLPAQLGWASVASLAVGLLPGWARRMYLLPPLPGANLATAAGMRALRAAVCALPEQYREGPIYRDAKARAAAIA